MGMVTAPFAAARRQEVRGTMLQYEPVTAGRIAFRFIVGDTLHAKVEGHAWKRAAAEASLATDRKALMREVARYGDVAILDALDGGGIEVACSCIEKMNAWMRYALKTWPSALYIGKTEDDTYVQLAVLEAELRALVDRRNLMLGYMTLAVLPTRPTRFPEQRPGKACVTLIQGCQKDARNRRAPYTEGCFLGDLESKLEVPAKLRFDAGNGIAYTPSLGDAPGASPLVGWWKGAVRECGMGGSPEAHAIAQRTQRALLHARNCSSRSECTPSAESLAAADEASRIVVDSHMNTMAPFPTGPLAVFGRDLAQSLFVDCAYLREYERDARMWGRKTLCKGPNAHLSFASTLCDTVLSHWVAKCAVDVTVAHTTRTKSHHYMWRGAGLGWMAPSNISLAIHYLKAKPHLGSGPNLTVGGEWSHTHASVRGTTRAAFPNLLYKMRSGYSLNVSTSRRLLRSLNPDVFHWYSPPSPPPRAHPTPPPRAHTPSFIGAAPNAPLNALPPPPHMLPLPSSPSPTVKPSSHLAAILVTRGRYSAECSFEHSDLRRAGVTRANHATGRVRGPRPKLIADAKWLGGHPPGWPFSGCNPSRFRPYPAWPPSPEVLQAIQASNEHYPGSERFVYFGHGPTAAELAPRLAAVSTQLAELGGAEKVSAWRFSQMLNTALAPKFRIGNTGPIAYALRKAEEKRRATGANLANNAVPSRKHLPVAQRRLLLEYVQARLSVDAYVHSLERAGTSDLTGEYAQRDKTWYWKWS